MKRQEQKTAFLNNLKRVATHGAKKKTVPCRCASCHNATQTGQGSSGAVRAK